MVELCPDHPRDPWDNFFMEGYIRRWVFTEEVLASEWEDTYHRVWFTYVYDLYNFDLLRPPSKKAYHMTVSKEGYLLDRLRSGWPHRITFKECVKRYNLTPGFTQL